MLEFELEQEPGLAVAVWACLWNEKGLSLREGEGTLQKP